MIARQRKGVSVREKSAEESERGTRVRKASTRWDGMEKIRVWVRHAKGWIHTYNCRFWGMIRYDTL